jgi:hypothetical protein
VTMLTEKNRSLFAKGCVDLANITLGVAGVEQFITGRPFNPYALVYALAAVVLLYLAAGALNK